MSIDELRLVIKEISMTKTIIDEQKKLVELCINSHENNLKELICNCSECCYCKKIKVSICKSCKGYNYCNYCNGLSLCEKCIYDFEFNKLIDKYKKIFQLQKIV